MSIYKSYKHGGDICELTKTYGVRKTYNSLKRKLPKLVRIKHNKIQMLNEKGNWSYLN